MSKWIDLEEVEFAMFPAIEKIGENRVYQLGWNDAITAVIENAPSIDIVFCKECVFLKVFNHKDLYAVCTKLDIQYEPFEDDTRTHYCAWGERQTERSE